jgi:hypothetical protein
MLVIFLKILMDSFDIHRGVLLPEKIELQVFVRFSPASPLERICAVHQWLLGHARRGIIDLGRP